MRSSGGCRSGFDGSRGDDAKVGSGASEGPEEVWVRPCGYSEDLSGGDDHAHGDDVVNAKTGFAHEITCACVR